VFVARFVRATCSAKMVCDFKELEVWKRSFDFADRVYDVVEKFPGLEIYALSDQLRRAVVSIFSNICEGCGKDTNRHFVSYLYNAMGSVREVEGQLMFARKRDYISEEDFVALIAELDIIGKMLMKFIKYVSSLDSR